MKIFKWIKHLFKHNWGEWYEGEIGKDFFMENLACKGCKKVIGRGGVLPPEPWPMPSPTTLKSETPIPIPYR